MLTLVIAAVPLCLVSNMSVAFTLKIKCKNSAQIPMPMIAKSSELTTAGGWDEFKLDKVVVTKN